MIRRLVTLLLAFAMLHLSVARADAACAVQHDAPAADHEGMHHDSAPPADEPPCDTPTAPECCQALASCAPVLGMDDGSHAITAPAIVHLTIAAAVGNRPHSRSTAPEPPPPKA